MNALCLRMEMTIVGWRPPVTLHIADSRPCSRCASAAAAAALSVRLSIARWRRWCANAAHWRGRTQIITGNNLAAGRDSKDERTQRATKDVCVRRWERCVCTASAAGCWRRCFAQPSTTTPSPLVRILQQLCAYILWTAQSIFSPWTGAVRQHTDALYNFQRITSVEQTASIRSDSSLITFLYRSQRRLSRTLRVANLLL